MRAISAIRQLRYSVSQIGSAISASQEYSRAAADTDEHRSETSRNGDRDWARYIPL